MSDPFQPLSAVALASLLEGASPADVRDRENSGALFSILPLGQESGRAYPAFQAWTGIAGEPLHRILRALGNPDGGTAWGFFSATSPELEGLTPVEVLSGKLVAHRQVPTSARDLMSADAISRVSVVAAAARSFVFDRDA